MTHDDTTLPLLPDLGRLIDRHGARAVALAFLRAAVTRRARPATIEPDRLGAHLRRDLGMPPDDRPSRTLPRDWPAGGRTLR